MVRTSNGLGESICCGKDKMLNVLHSDNLPRCRSNDECLYLYYAQQSYIMMHRFPGDWSGRNCVECNATQCQVWIRVRMATIGIVNQKYSWWLLQQQGHCRPPESSEQQLLMSSRISIHSHRIGKQHGKTPVTITIKTKMEWWTNGNQYVHSIWIQDSHLWTGGIADGRSWLVLVPCSTTRMSDQACMH